MTEGIYLMKRTDLTALLAVMGGLTIATAGCSKPADKAAEATVTTEAMDAAASGCAAKPCAAASDAAAGCAAKPCAAKGCAAKKCAAKPCTAKPCAAKP